MTSAELPKTAVAEHLAQKICALDVARLPEAVRAKCDDLLIDVVGLAVTARNEDYVKAALAGCDDDGPCTAIGHHRTLSAAAAALVNGTAIHGEDFDDTFEGGPIHAGAVIVPAVLAACERHKLDGRAALLGIAVGVETDGVEGRIGQPEGEFLRQDGVLDLHPEFGIVAAVQIVKVGFYAEVRDCNEIKYAESQNLSAAWDAACSSSLRGTCHGGDQSPLLRDLTP